MSKKKELIVDGIDCFAEDFEKIVISSEIIKNAEFEECTFISCNFSETLFRSCRFIDCRFENCNLSLLKLTDTMISGCEFIDSKMIGIDWTMCDWRSLLSSEPMRFKECILNDSNFYGLTQDRMEMKSCSVRESDFGSGSFKNANFSSSDFKGTLFSDTHLEYANFKEAVNTNINLTTNYVKGAVFSQHEALYLLENMGIVLVD